MQNTIGEYFVPSETTPGNVKAKHSEINYDAGISAGFVLALATVGSVRLTSHQATVEGSHIDLRKIPLPEGTIIQEIGTSGNKVYVTFNFPQ